MHLIFLLARVYPYWATALSVVLVQIAIFFRRRKNPMQFTCLGAVALLGIGIIAWFAYRGDVHSDDWVRYMIGQ